MYLQILGIIAIAAAMLMIGGEFDLSIGSMIGFAEFVLQFQLSIGVGHYGQVSSLLLQWRYLLDILMVF